MGKEGRASQSRLFIQLNMNWEMLPDDVWSLIGSKLDVAADRVRFRAVCKTWMSLLPFPPPIWLMIPRTHLHQRHHKEEEEKDVEQGVGVSSQPHFGGFVIAGEQHIYHHLDLPDKRCVGSTGTCLVTVDLDGNICVLDLISRVEISLPPQSTFIAKKKMPLETTPELERDSFISKIVLSSTEEDSIIAVAIHHHKNKLAIARPGDASWTLLDCAEVEVGHLEDIIFFKGKLYGVCSYGLVMVINIRDNLDSCEIFYFTGEMLEVNPECCAPKKYYLVEWMGELVLVVRHIVYPPDYDEYDGMKDINHPAIYNTQGFQLYKLDLPNKDLSENNWVELYNLGDHSLFLGLNTSVSLRVCDYNGSLERNRIYFTDDYSYACYMFYQSRSIRRGLDMGVYNLECKTIQPCYTDFVFPTRAAPIWVVPTLPSTESTTEQGNLITT